MPLNTAWWMPSWSTAWAIACRSRWASGLSFSDNRPFLRLKYIIAVPTCGTGQVSNVLPWSFLKAGASA